MADFLFPNFLADPEQYRLTEEFWLKIWEELIRDVGQFRLWKVPFYTTTFNAGQPCRDGNPISSAVDSIRRLGVRIIQFEPAGGVGEIASWVNAFAKGEPEEIKELVISCSLTNDTLPIARDLIRQWITAGRINGNSSVDQPNLSYLATADRPA